MQHLLAVGAGGIDQFKHGAETVCAAILSGAVEVARSVHDQSGCRFRPIAAGVCETIQHALAVGAGGIDQLKNSSSAVGAAAKSRAVEVARSVHDQTRFGARPIAAGVYETIKHPLAVGAGGSDQIKKRSSATCAAAKGRAVEVAR